MPLWQKRDRILRSLYRLYEDFCAGDLVMVTYETEWLFRQGSERWLIANIQDPQDVDPVRYAILASIVEALAASFNWRLELGLRRGSQPKDESEERATNFVPEQVPSWVDKVPGAKGRVDLINHDNERCPRLNPYFQKRNIEATTGHMYTV